jgi:membrane protein DedA with SNARE-associated domain
MSLLAGLLSAVESVVGAADGLGLAAAMAVESVFPPIPSEVVLPLAGSLVAAGSLSFLVAVLAATVGSVLGAVGLYGIGRFGGRPALLRIGPLLRIDEGRLVRAETWFARHGDLLVVVGRLVPGLRAVVSLPAGTARMPLWRFAALTALGSLIWNAGLIGIGEALAARWAEVAGAVAPVTAGLAVVAAAALLVARLRRRFRPAAPAAR